MLDKHTTSTPLFPPPTFFPSAKFNLAEFLLRSGQDSDVAIHFAREGVAQVERVTWGTLRERTRRVRDALVNSGVVAGDVVAAVISNSVNAVVICMATLSIGAMWSSSSPDSGTSAIVDRYGQVSPKIIFADDGYVYAGKMIQLEDRIAEWSHKLAVGNKQTQDVVVVPFCDLSTNLARIYHGCTLQTFLQRGKGEDLTFTTLTFSHPAFILYSSGTVSLGAFPGDFVSSAVLIPEL